MKYPFENLISKGYFVNIINMAKRQEKDESSIISTEEAFEEAFGIIDDLNPEATFLDQNALSNVTEYIDTGNYALNGIISGSLYGGVPMGRLTGFSGPESCGKTLIINKILSNAIRKGMRVAYFDSENALDLETASRLGCDTSKIKHVPIEVTEDCRNQVVKFLDNIREKKLNKKVIIVLDSAGNLITAQEKKKIDEGETAPDMGNRAKTLKSLFRAVTHNASKAQCPFVFSNHVYDDPSQLHKSAIKKAAGGSGPLYMASVLVQLTKRSERTEDSKNKDADKNVSLFAKDINGLTLRALTTKNRFVCPFLETEMYLNFKTGLNKYSGLLPMGVDLGIITKVGHQYAFNGKTLGYFKDWKNDKEVWESILPVLDVALKKELAFRNENEEIEEHFEYDPDSSEEKEIDEKLDEIVSE